LLNWRHRGLRWLGPPLAALLLLLGGCGSAADDPAPNLTPVTVEVPERYRGLRPFASAERQLLAPAGYRVQVVAAGLERPRFMAFGPDGALYVAEMGAGRIVRLPDADGDGVADTVAPVLTGLQRPHSLAWFAGDLYVGETGAITRFRQGKGPGERVVELPPGGMHFTRTVAFGPDGKMYVSTGSTCNACFEADPYRAAVWAFNPDGTDGVLYARGLRNSVGLAFHPTTGELWATENGRDSLGDDLPPEEINILQNGGDYGWPVCHAGNIVDPDVGKPGACDGKVPPAVQMQAHSAPLGIAFWRGDAYVAFHGSWNRSEPTGYKVVRVPVTAAGKPVAADTYEDFLAGFRSGGEVWGRPVGVTPGPDGALYVSDDFGGVIYRVIPSK
jgi:glucose/arabinose dehydrogenase